MILDLLQAVGLCVPHAMLCRFVEAACVAVKSLTELIGRSWCILSVGHSILEQAPVAIPFGL